MHLSTLNNLTLSEFTDRMTLFTPFSLVLVFCLVIHLQFMATLCWMRSLFHREVAIVLSISQGVSYLLYPFCGWLTEVYSSSYKVIECSFLPSLLSSIGGTVVGALYIQNTIVQRLYIQSFALGLATVVVIFGLLGLGMFEANAIQFGMDQMLDASSEQLSSFIHWYFWCTHVGPLVISYIAVATMSLSVNMYSTNDLISSGNFTLGVILTVTSCIQILALLFGLVFINWSKRLLSTEQMSRNSLSLLYRTVRYSLKHKYPERRSAFTYWENQIPSRIDLGKDKYGGPFTYEQVEDVKCFFRLLLLMLSLFGFHLLGNGYSITYYLLKMTGCPSLIPFLISVVNPRHIPLLVVIIGVPCLRVTRKKLISCCAGPSMLSRLWIGLYTALIAEAVQSIYGIFIDHGEVQCPDLQSFHSPLTECLYANVKMQTVNDSYSLKCSAAATSGAQNYLTIIMFLIIFLLYGISYMLIFMTTLEFVCAQSPNSMKGLLIGTWYSMLSIKSLLSDNLDIYFLETSPWSIYNCLKGFGIFVSVAIFSYISKNYRYRERNEVVNEYAIIEEQYERELLMNESISHSESSSYED